MYRTEADILMQVNNDNQMIGVVHMRQTSDLAGDASVELVATSHIPHPCEMP